MKKFFFMCLLLGITMKVYSQTITVKDSESGHPLELVTIFCDDPDAFSFTNSKGQADMSAFKGAKNIELRLLGYETVSIAYDDLGSINFSVGMRASSILLDDVVVSATRWNQVSRDVPTKIISISPKEVNLQNPQTAADLLNISGKVYIQKSQQGGGSPMIRGFATNRLLYTVDGVRMNTAIFRGGNIQNVISLDPFAIEHTEVFFGPGSVIYGSDAIGGVMSFHTIAPQLSLDKNTLFSGRALARFASANNETTGHFDINIGGEKWAMVTSFSTNQYGDLRMGSHGPEDYLRPVSVERINGKDVIVANDDPMIQLPSGYSQFNIMQKLRFKPNQKWDLRYDFHYSETSSYARYDRHIMMKDGLPRYGEWSYGPQKWMMNHFNITKTQGTLLYDQFTLRLAQQYFEESRISRDFNEVLRETRKEKVDALSANLDFLISTGRRNKIFYGLEMIWNGVKSTGINEQIINGTSKDGPTRYPQSDWISYGFYLTDQFNISEKMGLQAGVRYNGFNLNAVFDTSFYTFPFSTADISNGALTGSLGLVYRPGKDWVISTNLSTGFRAPNIDDIGKVFDSEPGAVVVPNPGLEAEYAYSADLSIAKIFSGILKLDLSAYYTLLDNAMVRRDYTLGGLDSIWYGGIFSKVQAIQNAALAKIYGIQAGIEIKFPAGFGFTSDLNYQKGIEELDNGISSPSRHAPPTFGTSRLTYRNKNFNAQIYIVYNDEKAYDDLPETEKGKAYLYALDGNGNPYAPAWYTLNLKLMYQLGKHLNFTGGIENMLDKRYRPYSSGIAAPGRNFLIAVKYSF